MAQTALWTPEEASALVATVRGNPGQTLTWDHYLSKLEVRLGRMMAQEPQAVQILVATLDEAGEHQLALSVEMAKPGQIPEMIVSSSENLMGRIGLRWQGETPPLTEAPASDLKWFNEVTLEAWAEEALL